MRQRIMIAMALLSQPDVLIADEPTTALDVTVQAQIVALLRQLQQEHGTSIIMVTHDLGLVAGLSDQVMVMYGGRVMEHAQADDIFYNTLHPYTRALLESVPRLEHADDALLAIPGMPPSLRNMPSGCPFAPRCARAESDCQRPAPLRLVNDGAADHWVACHHAGAPT
jgi:oligopeptide transport system ATP-binding protein